MTSSVLSRVEQPLADYFRERLHEEGDKQRCPPQEDTLWYMGDLLARFGDSEQVFSYDDGRLDLRPLALLYSDACESRDPRARCLLMRQLGDLALFIGALFPENYRRRGLYKDYFVGMGGGAYSYLSEHARHNRHVYSELASTFAAMLELVARACSRHTRFDAADVLRLYQRWQQSRDPQAGRQLQAMGVALSASDIVH